MPFRAAGHFTGGMENLNSLNLSYMEWFWHVHSLPYILKFWNCCHDRKTSRYVMGYRLLYQLQRLCCAKKGERMFVIDEFVLGGSSNRVFLFFFLC